ncbi:MAG: hypothetical protein ABI653_03275 [Bacteroidota bacterium]
MKNLSHEDIEQINNMKNYLDSLPPAVNLKKAYCFMITRDEINALLNQKNNGQLLDGLRIYLGANMIEGHAVPNIHVIACEKDEANIYNDFEPESNGLLKNDLPLVAQGKPCPTACGKKSFI